VFYEFRKLKCISGSLNEKRYLENLQTGVGLILAHELDAAACRPARTAGENRPTGLARGLACQLGWLGRPVPAA
jgi:hypothetical protein